MKNAKHSCRTSLAKSAHSYRSRYTQVHANEMSQVVVLPFSFECYLTDNTIPPKPSQVLMRFLRL
ncbi:hypothetical protein JG688_00008982 [Phytophthora aleatoria]|uniref:Uncharacterized protein n=1 Tax=Phytophthora aleatoria TaxID=2496075 RepID=A0A8J5J799_9STRA|nr:hypothetical protein JG688_00008982 [Phytophthora aleatoria]